MSNADERCATCGRTNCECALGAAREDAEQAMRSVSALRRTLDPIRSGLGDRFTRAVGEIASLRAALAAEREAHEVTKRELARVDQERAHQIDLRNGTIGDLRAERDAAIARAETAERERDDLRTQAEASLVVPCACGRPMPSVSSRLRCDACRAEGERDEARAQVAAMQARAERAEAALGRVLDWTVTYGQQLCPPPGVFDTYGEGMRVAKRHAASIANSSGAPLLAELRALRAVRDAAEPAAVCHDRMRCFGLSGFPRDGYVCPGCRLRAALNAAKEGT